MKNSNLLILIVLAFALAISTSAQTRLTGRVTEVVSGRTVVIDTDGRKITAELQFIEVPEPEQPLYQTVREHLEKLVLGKAVEFRPQGFSPGKATGQLFVGNTDIALQMLRDGAAWQIPADKSGQNEGDSSAYQYHQNQARMEKRGVWSVKDLKPAWQFRADRLDQARQERIAEDLAATRGGATFERASQRTSGKRASYWSDINPFLRNPGPLVNGYNAATKTGYVGTSLMGIKEIENLPPDQKIAVDITYFYKQEEKGRKGSFVLTLVSAGDQFHFLKSNSITVQVDDKNVFISKPNRVTDKREGVAVEKLTFEVSKTAIEKIVYGGDVTIQIGNYKLYPTQGLQLILYNMLQVAG